MTERIFKIKQHWLLSKRNLVVIFILLISFQVAILIGPSVLLNLYYWIYLCLSIPFFALISHAFLSETIRVYDDEIVQSKFPESLFKIAIKWKDVHTIKGIEKSKYRGIFTGFMEQRKQIVISTKKSRLRIRFFPMWFENSDELIELIDKKYLESRSSEPIS